MTPIKSILFILLSLITTHVFSQYTDVINSNRPGVSRSAFSVGTKVAQLEVGPYIIKEKRTPETPYKVSGFGVDFAVRYGLLWEELELNLEGSYQNDKKTYASNSFIEDSRSNFKYLSFGAKYLVYDPYKNYEKEKPNLYSWKSNHQFRWKSLIPAVSIYAGINFDTKNNPYTASEINGVSPKIMIATQNNFAGGWVFVMNLIKDRIGTNQSDFQYILTLTHSFSPKWVVFGEIQGIKSDFYADNLFRFGGAYLWNKNFQLDTALTFNAKDTPSVLGLNLGMSYRLDFHKDKKNKKEIEKEIDNGVSVNDEEKRKANHNGDNKKKKKKKKKNDKDDKDEDDSDEPIKKQQRDHTDFGNN